MSPHDVYACVITSHYKIFGHPSDHAAESVGLRQLAGWHCGFESHLEHGCFFLVRDECCKVEVPATGPSL